MIAAVIDPTALAVIVAAILGTGGITSFIAFRKAGPEVESISVSTLSSSVQALGGVVDELRDELRLKDERFRSDLSRKDATIDRLNKLIGQLEEKVVQAEHRISELEVDPPPHLG